MCSHFGNISIKCTKCKVSPSVLDYNRIELDLSSIKSDEIKLGDINHLGWFVVRRLDVSCHILYTLHMICEVYPYYVMQCTQHADTTTNTIATFHFIYLHPADASISPVHHHMYLPNSYSDLILGNYCNNDIAIFDLLLVRYAATSPTLNSEPSRKMYTIYNNCCD